MNIQVPHFENVRVLVLGDLMLDRYWSGETSRISPEAPVPVVHVERVENRPGGAANVAMNLISLGCQVSLIGIMGDDEAGRVLQQQLNDAGVDCHFHIQQQIPTITKLRVLGKSQQLIRLDFEEKYFNYAISPLLNDYKKLIEGADVIILSDYGKGVLEQAQLFIELANNFKKPVFVDPKSPDFTLYRGATCVTPNLKEFEQVVGPCKTAEDIIWKAQSLCHVQNLGALLVTQGSNGMTIMQAHEEAHHFKAHASEVYDVSGAGDTVISILAASYAAGFDLANATYLANIGAGIVVQKLGVATTTTAELRRALQAFTGTEFGIFTEQDLLVAVHDAKSHGERIVMTNGCFDLLHTGHITYLEQAKALGDRLIVAVNDDASVRRLKGSERPINCLQDRMKMLAAMRMIDWVVPFSEDTPARLISHILPDVLVKGGDYQINQIAGANQVLAHGGEVKILPFVAGYSSSAVIEKIRGEELCIS